MQVWELKKILDDNLSSGTLHPNDEVEIYNSADGKRIDIDSAECDTQTSDFLININK